MAQQEQTLTVQHDSLIKYELDGFPIEMQASSANIVEDIAWIKQIGGKPPAKPVYGGGFGGKKPQKEYKLPDNADPKLVAAWNHIITFGFNKDKPLSALNDKDLGWMVENAKNDVLRERAKLLQDFRKAADGG